MSDDIISCKPMEMPLWVIFILGGIFRVPLNREQNRISVSLSVIPSEKYSLKCQIEVLQNAECF